MRLAYCVRAIFPQHGYGGLERSASGLMRHLLLRRLDISLYTQSLPTGEQIPDTKLSSNREVSTGRLAVRTARYGRLPLARNGIPARLTNYRMFAVDMGSKVRAAALSRQVDAIYAHGLCAWGVRNAREWGVPMVANPHGMEEFKIKDPLKRLAYAPFRAWLRAGYRLADRVVATDYAMKDEVSSLLGVDPGRVIVLPNGVDLDDIRGAVDPSVRAILVDRWPELNGGEGNLLGISVGRLEANKGFEHLLRALALAQANLGRDWRWFFVGEGTLSKHLERVAGELGLRENVTFTGKLREQELHALYSSCNLFAHPTLYEGSSLVTLEAMAHALPVIASATGGIPDKVVDGETGFLVAPGDEVGLAARITWMAGHPHERVEMGRQGRRLAEAKFSWTHVAARTQELFLELLDVKVACRGQEVST